MPNSSTRCAEAEESNSRIDRWCLTGALAALLAASWAYLLYEDWAMRHMDSVAMAMPGAGAWSAADFALVFAMWAIMMVAMMLPSALPMVLIYRRLAAARSSHPLRLTAIFVAAYLTVWTAFSALATLAQWGLHTLALVTPSAILTSPWLAAALLIAAGAYQWTAAKRACLTGCAAPLQFLQTHWRDGAGGAWRMGMVHGAYCVGCCGLLMALLFVYGVMNLVWIGALAAYVLAEKLLPTVSWLPRATGVVLIGWAVVLVAWR
jgi:predicted metal-binding membrane protein